MLMVLNFTFYFRINAQDQVKVYDTLLIHERVRHDLEIQKAVSKQRLYTVPCSSSMSNSANMLRYGR